MNPKEAAKKSTVAPSIRMSSICPPPFLLPSLAPECKSAAVRSS
jgi:hypothetical protein